MRDGLVDACAAPVEPWQRGRLNEEPRHLPGQLRHAEGCQGHKRQLEHDSRFRSHHIQRLIEAGQQEVVSDLEN